MVLKRDWPKPANLSFEDAAAVPIALGTALQGLREKKRIQPGLKVLVKARLTLWVHLRQIAKALGAEVTAPCGTFSKANNPPGSILTVHGQVDSARPFLVVSCFQGYTFSHSQGRDRI